MDILALLSSFIISIFSNNKPAEKTNNPQVLAASTESQETLNKYTFNVQSPAFFFDTTTFKKDIVAPNVVYSFNGNSGDVTLGLTAGDGISVDGFKITNTGIKSLVAGTNISIDGNKITNTYSAPTPDYTLSGWTDNGTSITLTTTTDSVTVGSLTAGAITASSLTTDGLSLNSDLTVASSHSLLPSTDLGSDIGSASKRFNNLWVANINSNSSQSFSGQTTFSFAPTDTTVSTASVFINPTTSVANGQLLGLGVGGYQKALIDEDGDIILGYSDATSAPASDYPLNIYGHNGTRVSFVDTSGNGYFAGNVGIGTTAPGVKMDIYDYDAYDQSRAIIKTKDRYYTFYIGGNKTPTTGEFSIMAAGGQMYLSNGSNSAVNLTNVSAGTMASFGTLQSGLGGFTTLAYMYHASTDEVAYQLNYTTNKAAGNDTGLLIAMTDTASPGTSLGLNYTVGSTTKFNIDNNGNGYFAGNVGIGTTAPQEKLQIESAGGVAIRIQRSDNLVASGRFDFSGSDGVIDSRIGYNNAVWKGLEFYTGGTTSDKLRLLITDDGNVGIGTTAPNRPLSVTGNAGISGILYTTYAWGEAGNPLYLGSNGGSRWVVDTASYGGPLGSLHPFNGGAYDLGSTDNPVGKIYASGNVGIGTTAPSAKLHLSGALGSLGITVDSTDNSGILIRKAAASGSASLYFRLTDNTQHWELGTLGDANFAIKDSQAAKTPFKIISGTSVDNTLVLNAGNVGIGTTSPQGQLHIKNISGGITNNIISLDTTINANAGGGVEIWRGAGGASTNIGRLSMAGYADNYITGAVANDMILSSPSSNSIIFGNTATGVEWARIKNGNVGIGTTAPTSKLHVSGAVTGKALAIFDETGDQNLITASASGTTKFAINRSGNLILGGATVSAGIINVPDNTAIYGGNSNPGILFNNTSGVKIGFSSFTTNLNVFDNYIAASTSNTERLRIISSGNVGIGTTAPTSKLHVSGAVTGKALAIFDETGDQALLTASASGVTKFTIDYTGNIGNGSQTNPFGSGGGTRHLTIQGVGANQAGYLNLGSDTMSTGTNTYGGIRFYDYSGTLQARAYIYGIRDNADGRSALTFSTGAGSGTAERMRIDYLGNVGIGTTAPGYALDVKASGTGVIARFNSDNTSGCTIADGGTISCSSDRTLKKNVLGLNYGLADVMKMNPVSFNWNFDGDNKDKSLGFIAQDMEVLIPGLVSTDEKGIKSLNTIGLIPVLTKAIQEQEIKFLAFVEQIKDKFRTKELCLGEDGNETCVNKAQLDELIKLLPTSTPAPIESLTPTPEVVSPSPSPVATPTVSPTIEPSPVASPTI